MWYEPNLILEKYHYYAKEYLKSLNNKFNGTITYRSDSMIRNWVYGGGCHYKRKPFGSIDNQDISEEVWNEYLSSSAQKSRQLFSYFINIFIKLIFVFCNQF